MCRNIKLDNGSCAETGKRPPRSFFFFEKKESVRPVMRGDLPPRETVMSPNVRCMTSVGPLAYLHNICIIR